jgi:hypothetical protein
VAHDVNFRFGVDVSLGRREGTVGRRDLVRLYDSFAGTQLATPDGAVFKLTLVTDDSLLFERLSGLGRDVAPVVTLSSIEDVLSKLAAQPRLPISRPALGARPHLLAAAIGLLPGFAIADGCLIVDELGTGSP